MEVFALLDTVRFYIVEAVDELLVGLFQRIVRIDFVEAGSVDEAEHDIAEFSFSFFLIHVVDFCLELPDFFFYLIPHLFAFFPVESYIACLVLDAVGLDERG